MKLNRKFQGIIVASLTPFDSTGQFDEKTYREHIEFLIQRGAHGLFLIATMGEGANITLNVK